MSSIKKDIEDAVVAILNDPGRSPPFSMSFTAERGPKDIKKLEESSDLQVIIAAVPIERKRLTRGQIQWNFQIGIGLFKKVGFIDGAFNIAAADLIAVLAEEFADAIDVNLSLATARANGPLAPEVDYNADDGQFWAKGIAAMQVNATQLFFVNRH